jgi:hypothetical protein
MSKLETMGNIYRSMQLLKRPWIRHRQARWYVVPFESMDLDGPFEAVEIAYQIYVGLIGERDHVVNAETWTRYVVGKEPFLAVWRRRSPDKENRLYRGLLRSYDELTRLRASSSFSHSSRPVTRLTAEQERAFRVLDLEPSASAEERKRRHRALALEHHPDRGGSVERMKEINWAFDVVQHAAVL